MRAKRGSGTTKRGTAPRMPVALYPKRYTVEVTRSDDGETDLIARHAENFTAYELYGLLKLCLLEIERQMRIRPEDELKIQP